MAEARASNGAAAAGTLASAVSERLRSDVLSGALAPGEKLKIDAMCARYAAGASPVREALNRLAAEGLLVQHDQRGFTVAPVSLADLRELVDTRCALEGLALERSIAAHDVAWEERIVLAAHRLFRTPRSIDPESYRTNPEWERHHRAFHEALIAGCGSRHLLRYCADLRDRADRYRQLAAARVYPRRNEGDEHKAILAATVAGRAAEAVSLLCAHYRTTLAIIEAGAEALFEA